jgi:uncharacterized protein YciI/uncharacterized protein YndB with AHSA1/START domain
MMTALPPIRREVLVEAAPERAFEVFTARIGDWWPVGGFSVHGEGGTVSFAGGEIVERSAAGETSVWGTVTRWEPPGLVAFSWHPGQPAELATQVTVTFAASGGSGVSGTSGEQTLVTLEHSGWEARADAADVYEGYGPGWTTVLERFREGAGAGDEPVWVALLHTPGPAAPAEGLFEAPLFGEHAAFLRRMHERGYLVAAGPLGDADGEGMTILRLPGRAGIAEATRLATEDDLSVAGGFFTVRVRPWQVMMQG